MNKVVLMGRLTRDPDVRYSQGETPLAIARYTLAVDRRFKRNGEQDADFINCVAFGRTAEFAEKYLKQGTKMVVSGRIQTGSYTNRDGVKVYTTEVVIEEQDFAESKAAAAQNSNMGVSQPSAPQPSAAASDGFMNIPDGLEGFFLFQIRISLMLLHQRAVTGAIKRARHLALMLLHLYNRLQHRLLYRMHILFFFYVRLFFSLENRLLYKP